MHQSSAGVCVCVCECGLCVTHVVKYVCVLCIYVHVQYICAMVSCVTCDACSV